MTADRAAYRPNVGVVLFNRAGQVWYGRRHATPGPYNWQFPQGGVDEGEDLRCAALRELAEETGVGEAHASIIGQTEEPIRYDLPDDLQGKLWGGRYRGQEQIWFCARFTGSDADVNLNAHEPPEFCDWKWVDPEDLPDLIVPFKKRVYRSVVDAFRELV